MNRPGHFHLLGVILLAASLLGACTAPPLTEVEVPTIDQPPPPPPTPSLDLPLPPAEPPHNFQFIQTIQVTPDEKYLSGAFARIFFVPASDHFVVTFGGYVEGLPDSCGEKAFSYKEYSLDMLETGRSGVFSCDPFDAGSIMVENTYYFAAMAKVGEEEGWHLLKIDAATWDVQVDTFFPVDVPQKGIADPMLSFVDGKLDISAQYDETGAPPATMTSGAATHHHFFTPDLELIDEWILADTPHIGGSALIFVDGIYYLVTADGFLGDLIMMKYDRNWNYLGKKTLIEKAHWSTGLVFDGSRFFLAYMDTRQRIDPERLPVYLNVHLAAFDQEWNLLEDIPVTNFAIPDNRQPGRPWLLLHGNRLYLSYDVDTIDPATGEEQLMWQAYVSVFELPVPP